MAITWDSVNKGSSVTLSNGNLTAVVPNNSNTVRATEGKSSGKWYWEIKITSVSAIWFGIINSSASLTSNSSNTNNVRYFYHLGGTVSPSSSKDALYSATTNIINGNTIGMLLDLDSGTMEMSINGVRQGVAFKDILSMGEVFPAITGANTTGSTTIVNFGAMPFEYEMPVDYKAYDPQFVNKILIQLGSGEYCKQTRRFVSGEVVPTLSSGNEQGFEITANEFNSTQVPLNAFDNNTTTTWRTVKQNKQGWLAVKLPESLNVISYYIKGTPSTWTFEGSSDGVNWTILDTQTNTNPESGKKYNINNNNDFLHYRINVQSVTSGSYVYVYDMQLYIEPIIQSTYLESNSEQNFINHGMDTDTEINISAEMTNKIFIEQTPTILGEGKVFSKKIDTSKIPIKSVTIE